MAYVGPVRRWDIFWADLDPALGREQRGESRPVIVVSNDGFNARFQMATVVPATKLDGKKRKVFAFEVVLPQGTLTPEYASVVMPHQIRSISTIRLLGKIGVLHEVEHRADIENRILEHLDIAFEAEGLS